MKLTPPRRYADRAALFVVLVGACLCVSLRAAAVPEVAVSLENPPQTPTHNPLALGPDGFYWGTSGGGTYGMGTIYKVRANGSQFTRVVAFTGNGIENKGSSPSSGLLKVGSEDFWGMTSAGGAAGYGTVFKLNAFSGVLTTVLEFTRNGTINRGSGPRGELLNDGAGYLWAVTGRWLYDTSPNGQGTIFKIDVASGALTTVVEFTNKGAVNKGSSPNGALIKDGNGFLWGTTSNGGIKDYGTIFKLDPTSGELTTVVQFNYEDAANKGVRPLCGLCDDGNGFLWGTASEAGTIGYGTLFKLNRSSGGLTTVVNFTEYPGTYRGYRPMAKLVSDGNGFLWGSTYYGGTRRYGNLFKVNTATDVIATVVDFSSSPAGSEGAFPTAGLLDEGDGNFIGTTSAGGLTTHGTVFRVNKATGVLTSLVTLGTQPRQPTSNLIDGGDGLLWGTTERGGAKNTGAIVAYNPVTGKVIEQASLNGNTTTSQESFPNGRLVTDGAGVLWGTTSQGGSNNNGTVFKFNRATKVLTTVVMFSNNGPTNRGATPRAGLVNDGLGFLWGTTSAGGALGYGTVFKVDVTTGGLTTWVDFSGNGDKNKGAAPHAALTADGVGFLWGTTQAGGEGNYGTLFKVDIVTGDLTTVLHFTNNGASNQGRGPTGALLNDGHGFLWGTTVNGGVTDYGTIFKVEVATGVLTTVINFTYFGPTNTGGYPYAGLLDDGNGSLWGTTYHGGAGNYGTVFRLNVATGVLTTVVEFTGAGPQADSGGHSGYGSLVRFSDGNIYGASSEGGPAGGGNIYRIRLGATPVTLAGLGVTPSGVKLRGTVNPHGAATSYRFEYGTAAGSLTGSTGVGVLAAGTEVMPVAVSLGNLLPGTTYYYRLRADNAEQLQPQYGEVLSFTTPGTQTYAQWTLAHGLTLSGAGEDADGDGVPNLVEYGFGLDPGSGDAQLLPQPQWSGVGGGLVVSFTEPPGLTGLTYGAESSESLAAGSWVPVPDTGTGGNHVFVLPVTGGKCFLRLKVSVP